MRRNHVNPPPPPQSAPKIAKVTRTESVDLSKALLQSQLQGTHPLAEWEELPESQDPNLLVVELEDQQQQQQQKKKEGSVGKCDKEEAERTQTSLLNLEQSTELVNPNQQQQQQVKVKTPAPPVNIKELRSELVKSSFIPLSSGRMQDVAWFIVGPATKINNKFSMPELEQQDMTDDAIYWLARNRSRLTQGDIEMTRSGWVNLIVMYTLPVYHSAWPILCTCKVRELWKNVELYCYLVYCQLWADFRYHGEMVKLTGAENDSLLTYQEWSNGMEKIALEKYSVDVRIPDGCSEADAQPVVKTRITYLLRAFSQCELTNAGDPIVLFRKRTMPVYSPAIEGIDLPAITSTEQGLTATLFHRAGCSGAADKSRTISFHAQLFPISLIPNGI